MAAHEEGRRGHEEVQHASGQDRNVWLLPRQRLHSKHQGGPDGQMNRSKDEMTDGLVKDHEGFNTFQMLHCNMQNMLRALTQ